MIVTWACGHLGIQLEALKLRALDVSDEDPGGWGLHLRRGRGECGGHWGHGSGDWDCRGRGQVLNAARARPCPHNLPSPSSKLILVIRNSGCKDFTVECKHEINLGIGKAENKEDDC